jgi:hypothetical protein
VDVGDNVSSFSRKKEGHGVTYRQDHAHERITTGRRQAQRAGWREGWANAGIFIDSKIGSAQLYDGETHLEQHDLTLRDFERPIISARWERVWRRAYERGAAAYGRRHPGGRG